MRFIFKRLFWGVLLIIWGFGLLLDELLDIDLPLGMITFSIVLIWAGLYLIFTQDKASNTSTNDDKKY